MLKYPIVQAPSGRMYFRHSSGMGSVMIFRDRGTWKRVLILDSIYRNKRKMGLYKIEVPEINHLNRIVVDRRVQYWRLVPGSDEMIDASLTFWDPNTAKENGDIYMKYSEVEDKAQRIHRSVGPAAIKYCRSILVNERPCDLPNIQTLMRIYTDRKFIDRMDPTVGLNIEFDLANWIFGTTRSAWSSSSYTSSYQLAIYEHALIEHDLRRYATRIVIPILEL